MSAKKKVISVLCGSANELDSELKATLQSILDEKAKLNLPLVYRNSLCKRRNQFVHEYPDGKKLLIEQNIKTSEEIVLREL